MILKRIDADFSVCKVADFSEVDMSRPFCFTAKTDEENSVVCQTEDVPANTTERDDGWKGFRIEGVLDFSLIGILSKISGILADNKIGIFAISTYNTDYVLVKQENYECAIEVLKERPAFEIRSNARMGCNFNPMHKPTALLRETDMQGSFL